MRRLMPQQHHHPRRCGLSQAAPPSRPRTAAPAALVAVGQPSKPAPEWVLDLPAGVIASFVPETCLPQQRALFVY